MIAEALILQQELLAEYQGVGQTDGFVYEEIAECLLALGRTAEARPYFAQAYNELSQVGWVASSEPERLARLKQLGNEA